MPGGQPKKYTVKQMEEKWEEFKRDCDSKHVLAHEFSQKLGKFVSQELKKSVTYTKEKFCLFIKLDRSAFYDTYEKDPEFSHIVTRIKNECEADVREKFELGLIPHQLSALWMSKYGYSAKTDTSITERVVTKIVIGEENDEREDSRD